MSQLVLKFQLVAVRGEQPSTEVLGRILCHTASSLGQVHQSIFQAMQFTEVHGYAFYLHGEPFASRQDEYGSPVAQIPNPVEAMFHYMHMTIHEQYPDGDITHEQFAHTINELNKKKMTKADIPTIQDASTITLEAAQLAVGQIFFYVYDFGEGWIFQILVEEYQGTEVATKNHPIILTTPVNKSKPRNKNHIPIKKQASRKTTPKKPVTKASKKVLDLGPLVKGPVDGLRLEEEEEDVNEDEEDVEEEDLSKVGQSSRKNAHNHESTSAKKPTFVDSTTLTDLMPFILNFAYQLSMLDDWDLMQFFQNSKLAEPAKIVLASVLLHRTRNIMQAAHSGIFKYLYARLRAGQYGPKEEVQDFVLHCFKVFEICPDPTQLQALQQALQDSIPLDRWESCTTNLQKRLAILLGNSKGQQKRIKGFDDELRIFSDPITMFSVVPAKMFVFLFMESFPQAKELILTNIHTLLTSQQNYVHWGTIFLEYFVDQADTLSTSAMPTIIAALEPLTKHPVLDVRRYSYILLWMLTNQEKFLQLGAKDPAKGVQKRFPSLLKDPERARQRLLHKIMKETLNKYELFTSMHQLASHTEQSPEAVYIFKVQLADHPATRTLAFVGSQTLDDLHTMIQETFNWDNDHLYAFFMHNRPYRDYESYYSPDDEEEPKASDKKLYTLGLLPGKVFTYVFDFGDDNEFKVETVGITSQTETPGPYPKLLAKKGKSPAQYADRW